MSDNAKQLPEAPRSETRAVRGRKVRPRGARAVTEPTNRLSQTAVRLVFAQSEYDAELERARPLTRGDCEGGARPCPYVSCRYNLFLDVSPQTGAIKRNFPDREPDEMHPERSCALDLAERNGATLEDVAEAMNLVRERVRQLEVSGLAKLRDSGKITQYADGDRAKPHRRLPLVGTVRT